MIYVFTLLSLKILHLKSGEIIGCNCLTGHNQSPRTCKTKPLSGISFGPEEIRTLGLLNPKSNILKR